MVLPKARPGAFGLDGGAWTPALPLPKVCVKEQLETVRHQVEMCRDVSRCVEMCRDVSRCVEMFGGCKFGHVASKCVSCLCRPDAMDWS